jgi:hypothetical protein
MPTPPGKFALLSLSEHLLRQTEQSSGFLRGFPALLSLSEHLLSETEQSKSAAHPTTDGTETRPIRRGRMW